MSNECIIQKINKLIFVLKTNFSMYGGFFGGKKLKHNKNKIKSPILFAIQGEGNTNIK